MQRQRRGGRVGGEFLLRYWPEGSDPETDEPSRVARAKNSLTNAGGVRILDKLIGSAGTVLSNANAYVGVGDSNAVTTPTMTDLQASTNKFRKGMDATYPKYDSGDAQAMLWRMTLASGEGNYALKEVGLFDAASAGNMIARAVVDFGTKSGGTLEITYRLRMPSS